MDGDSEVDRVVVGGWWTLVVRGVVSEGSLGTRPVPPGTRRVVGTRGQPVVPTLSLEGDTTPPGRGRTLVDPLRQPPSPLTPVRRVGTRTVAPPVVVTGRPVDIAGRRPTTLDVDVPGLAPTPGLPTKGRQPPVPSSPTSVESLVGVTVPKGPPAHGLRGSVTPDTASRLGDREATGPVVDGLEVEAGDGGIGVGETLDTPDVRPDVLARRPAHVGRAGRPRDVSDARSDPNVVGLPGHGQETDTTDAPVTVVETLGTPDTPQHGEGVPLGRDSPDVRSRLRAMVEDSVAETVGPGSETRLAPRTEPGAGPLTPTPGFPTLLPGVQGPGPR